MRLTSAGTHTFTLVVSQYEKQNTINYTLRVRRTFLWYFILFVFFTTNCREQPQKKQTHPFFDSYPQVYIQYLISGGLKSLLKKALNLVSSKLTWLISCFRCVRYNHCISSSSPAACITADASWHCRTITTSPIECNSRRPLSILFYRQPLFTPISTHHVAT